MTTKRSVRFVLLLLSIVPGALSAQVPPERLLRAAAEPQNWLTYSGSYFSQRHSPLRDVTAVNVKDLELKWVFQAQSLNSFSATPLVVDGVIDRKSVV